MVRVACRQSPFSGRVRQWTCPEGVTLADILAESGLPVERRRWAKVAINGVEVPPEWWERVRPKSGAVVAILGMPGGFGGGASLVPKDTTRLLLMTLSTAAGAFVPGMLGLSGAAQVAAQLGLSFAGMVAVNALVPAPLTGEEFKAFSVTGMRNALNPYGRVPRLLGRMRFFPQFGGQPHTEIQGNDQYLRLLFLLGLGPMEIRDPKIGATPIAEFDGVQLEVLTGDEKHPSLGLYTNDIHQEVFERELEYAESWDAPEVVRYHTVANTDEIQIDITFPEGLCRTVDGRFDPYGVEFMVQFREAGPRPPGNEEVGWKTYIPDPEEVIRTLAETPTSQSVVYQWLEQANTRLEELLEQVTYAFRGEGVQVEFLTQIQQRIARALERWGWVEANPQWEAIRTAGRELLERWARAAGEANVGMPSGPNDALTQQSMDMLQVYLALIEANQVLRQGYNPDGIMVTQPILNWWIWGQGLDQMFGTPTPGAFTVVDRRTGAVRFGLRWTVPTGTWEVRVRRVSKTSRGEGIFERATWTAIRSVRYRDPLRFNQLPPVAAVAMRVKASEQLSGVLDQFSVECTAKLPAWTGTAWTQRSSQHGRNPAWCYAEVLRDALAHQRYGRSITRLTYEEAMTLNDRLDLEAIKAWADFCDQEGLYCDAVVEQSTTVLELLKRIAAVGQASYSVQDGRFGVIIDQPGKLPVQVFTPRNSRDFRASKAFRQKVHALKVRYINPDAEWQQDEWIVYADGYAAEAGPAVSRNGETVEHKAATNIEELTLWGITDAPDREDGSQSPYRTGMVDRIARYTMAQVELRPEVYELEADAEYLVARRGDVVLVQHDVLLVGLGHGRVEAVEVEDGAAVGVTLDSPIYLEVGKFYGIRVRTADGTLTQHSIIGWAEGWNTSVRFSTPYPQAESPIASGDLYWWGEHGKQELECVVKEVRPTSDFGARLTLVPYAPAIFSAHEGLIPRWDPVITIPPVERAVVPPAPHIVSIRSDESVLMRSVDGSLEPRILMTLGPPPMSPLYRVRAVQVQYRNSLGTWAGGQNVRFLSGWTTLASYSMAVTEVSVMPVDEGETYDLRVRYVTETGQVSPWAAYRRHKVVGKTTPPPSITTLLFEGERLRWWYPDPPPDLRGFIVRYIEGTGGTWETATPAHDGVLGATVFDFPIEGGGVRTWFVKAIDTAGLESRTAARATQNLGDPIVHNVLFEHDFKALGWPGDRWNMEVNGLTGVLEATSTAGLFWSGADGRRFWGPDPEAFFWGQEFDPCEWVGTVSVPAEHAPAILKIDYDIEGYEWDVWWREGVNLDLWPESMDMELWPESMDHAFWGFGSGWQAWPGQVEIRGGAEYQFRVRIAGGAQQGRINEFRVLVDVHDIWESVQDLHVPAEGARLPLKNTYRAVLSVTLALQHWGGYTTARTVEVLDKDPVLGPLVQVYDANHNPVSGLIDAHVKGY